MARVRICTCESRNATPTQPQPVSRMHLINHYRQFWVPCELAKHAKVNLPATATATSRIRPSNQTPCFYRISTTTTTPALPGPHSPNPGVHLTTWPHMARPRQPHSSFVPFGWTDRTPSSFNSVACASLLQRITVQYPSYDII